MKRGIEGVYDRLSRAALADSVLNVPDEVTAGMNVVVDNSKPFVIKDLPDNSTYTSGPYGILTFAKSATPDELREAAERNSAAKYWYMDKGDYYRSWKAAWRQRLCERILEGITTVGLGD